MKRCLAIVFLSVFLITYFIPVTSVFATEVTWGENNTLYLSNEELYTCRQLATLDMVSQLCSNGVNDLSISNTNSVDDFIINFLDYIDTNAESTVSDIYSVCNDIKNEIDSKANEIGISLKSIGTNLNNSYDDIIDWFDDLTTIPKVEYKTNPNFVSNFNRLSKIANGNNQPNPNPNTDYLQLLNQINPTTMWWYTSQNTFTINSPAYSDKTFFSCNISSNTLYLDIPNTYYTESGSIINVPIQNFYIYSVNGTYYFDCPQTIIQNIGTWKFGTDQNNYTSAYRYNNYNMCGSSGYTWGPNISGSVNTYNFNGTLESVLTNIGRYFRNVNIYVDGDLWSYVGGELPNTNVIININGIETYGNDRQPITYYYPQGTQIDYKKLYDVIKKAIDDSTSINNQTIWEGDTYYDSHDSIYSPNIYNYYSDDDSEDEEDVLTDILTLAVIPKFDTALLAPIEEPITNGTIIMFAGVQVFPEDILFVLGAAFVLILFVAMINRLIE